MSKFREIYEIWRKDNLLAQALGDSLVMLDKTKSMFDDAVKRLRHGDVSEKFDVYAEDRLINEFQIEVRRKVLRHLGVTGTVNLVPGLVLTSIVIDIERIGDYTKNIIELTLAHPERLTCGSAEEAVSKIEETIDRMFDGVPTALETSNKEQARDLIDGSRWIRNSADEVLSGLIRGADPSLGRGESAAVALYVRYLKRVGAHLLNILSSVVNPFERIGYREDS